MWMFEDTVTARNTIDIPTIIFKDFQDFFNLYNLIFSGSHKSQYNKNNKITQLMRDRPEYPEKQKSLVNV